MSGGVSSIARLTSVVALSLGAVLLACGASDEHGHAHQPGPVVAPPTGAEAELEALVPVPNKSQTPGVVEVDLEAKLGRKVYGDAPETEVWTYNGTVPGAFLDAKVGDRLVVNFKNALPEPTTVHWHGVRLPAAMDGTLAMQQPVPAGGTFRYEFVLKDAGLFWFHPHMRSDIQVQKGLYGALRVRAASEPESDVERVLVLDDIKLERDGRVSETLDDNSRMMGREGNTLLVNGTSNARLTVPTGGVVRLRLVNVANGRFFKVRVPGHTLRVIGSDGGFVPRPYDTETVLMSPGERYDVLFVAKGAEGSEITVMNEPHERGHESGMRPASPLMKLRLGAPRATPAPPLPDAFAPIERLPEGPVAHTVTLDEKPNANGDYVFTIDGKTFPDVPPIVIPNGQVRVWEVKNDSDMEHPFHLHGFFFQVLARSGVATPADRLLWKDTEIVPSKGSIRFVARFDEPGSWMYHCHILEHGERGMMGEIKVQ